MFGFFADMGNYESRKVAKDEYEWGFVSTAEVSDGRKPYETAVKHTRYNDGKIVIVECYDSKERARKGHGRWVARMTAEKLPGSLTDCANSEIQQAIDAAEGKPAVYPRKD